MKYTLTALAASAACGLLILGTSPADAKGCLKGAAVGGVAGHMAGHGVMGAAGGCAVGHHMANKADRNSSVQSDQQPSNSGSVQSRP